MADFSGKVTRAYYINKECNTIRVEYNDGDRIRGYVIPANEHNPDYKALAADGWDVEKIMNATDEMRIADGKRFARIVNEEVEIRLAEVLKRHNLESYQNISKAEEGKTDTVEFSIDHSKFWDIIVNNNKNKDAVFGFKMWAIDSELMKKATTDQKKALRRSQTILEGLSVLYLMQ